MDDITELTTLGWEPIELDKLTNNEIGRRIYNLEGNDIGTVIGFDDKKLHFKDDVFGDEYFLVDSDFDIYSLKYPSLEVSLVALGFKYMGNCYDKDITPRVTISCTIVEDRLKTEFECDQNDDITDYVCLPLPTTNSIVDLKEVVRWLTKMFVS